MTVLSRFLFGPLAVFGPPIAQFHTDGHQFLSYSSQFIFYPRRHFGKDGTFDDPVIFHFPQLQGEHPLGDLAASVGGWPEPGGYGVPDGAFRGTTSGTWWVDNNI